MGLFRHPMRLHRIRSGEVRLVLVALCGRDRELHTLLAAVIRTGALKSRRNSNGDPGDHAVTGTFLCQDHHWRHGSRVIAKERKRTGCVLALAEIRGSTAAARHAPHKLHGRRRSYVSPGMSHGILHAGGQAGAGCGGAPSCSGRGPFACTATEQGSCATLECRTDRRWRHNMPRRQSLEAPRQRALCVGACVCVCVSGI